MVLVCPPELNDIFIELGRAKTKEWAKQREKRIVCVDQLEYTSSRGAAKQLMERSGRGSGAQHA